MKEKFSEVFNKISSFLYQISKYIILDIIKFSKNLKVFTLLNQYIFKKFYFGIFSFKFSLLVIKSTFDLSHNSLMSFPFYLCQINFPFHIYHKFCC